MNDDLVKRARAQMAKWDEHIKSIGGEITQQGFMPLLCDRIEELETYAAGLEANGLANRVAIMRLEARAERLEEAMIQMRDDRTAFRHAVHFRRFITTILKGTDHE